jgi:hypothetical protein
MRWRFGDTNPVVAAVSSSTVIEIGDLLWQDTNQAKPASYLPSAGKDAHDLQEDLADSFLGVAMQRSRAGDIDPIRIATTGVFEFDCLVTTFELGDLIGGDPRFINTELTDEEPKQVGYELENQTVEKVSAARFAIGRCAKYGHKLESVLVDIRSTVMTGGIEGSTPSK